MATAERAARTADTVPDAAADTVSMRDLLASCAAASAVSTPPRRPRTAATGAPDDEHGATPRFVRDQAA
ncbi:hypothetical protein [Streptomyces roseicoloratus]|uniref:Uncharacterized protein n=1 Tax=Streptomyces roseicoloratus TaxID=2508722 RepID=A0ABY9RU44_9ACTN|nr:hypothetical protein [Streptomyces roseicoloratus]WMX45485.1 hypothetical protein RGF97_12375 [Streptomyces roseicoloratus]